MFRTKSSGRVLVDIEIQENIGFYYSGCEPPDRNCEYSYDVGASVVSCFNCYLCFRYESKEFSLFQLIFIVCFITVFVTPLSQVKEGVEHAFTFNPDTYFMCLPKTSNL